jgi:hypothetical protein
MTRTFIRIVAIVLLNYFIFYVNSAPFLDSQSFNIFQNPLKDFLNSVSPTTEKVQAATPRPNVTEGTSMIIVPLNIESEEACKENKTEMDITGICRLVWN